MPGQVFGHGPGNPFRRGANPPKDSLRRLSMTAPIGEVATARAVAENDRFVSDPTDLFNELLGHYGREKAERIWDLAGAIFDGAPPEAA
jgi:hypothetical protein